MIPVRPFIGTDILRDLHLFNVNEFYATHLEFKARTGCLGIKENLERWGISDPMCDLCGNDKEVLTHFLFLCPTFNDKRKACYKKLESELRCLGHEELWFRFCGSSVLGKLCLFLGDHGYLHSNEIGALFDKICKEFLFNAWKLRRESCTDQPDPT